MRPSRRSRIAPFYAMDVLRAANARAADGEDVLHLEVGEPRAGPPRGVIEAAHRALDGAFLGYTEALGTDALRRRIARHYRSVYGVDVVPERIVVTMGSSGAFILAFLAAFDAGERIVMASPTYPGYRNTLSALGLEPVVLPSGPAERYQPTIGLLERLEEPVAGLIVASPSNPSGTMLEPGRLALLARWCAERGARLISDEVYHGITYTWRPETAAVLGGGHIVVNSFSKYFAMTGFRLGWMVLPEDLLRPVERLAQNLFVSPAALAQHAALVAFECTDDLDANVARYAENRRILLDELPKAGMARFAPPDGAFYLYADVSELTDDSERFCRAMLAETGVAATPGIDFDPERGRRFVRFSFAGETPEIVEAVRRLRAWRQSYG